MSSRLALEFVHPDFGRRPGDTGLRHEQTGLRLAGNLTLSVVDGAAAVRQAILILLTTRPGERVMRPDYGCQLQSLSFAPNDQTTAGLAIHYVRQALERWEPRIGILRVDAERNPDTHELLDIYLEYRILVSNRTEHLEISVSLSGRET